MANATRDPFWRAMVAAEVATSPTRQAEIEAKCLRCHAPMTSEIASNHGHAPEMAHLAQLDTDLGLAGQDGVSCTVCHQIQPDGLGTERSYDGGFVIDGSRRIFGPHADPFTMPMSRIVRFAIASAMRESEICSFSEDDVNNRTRTVTVKDRKDPRRKDGNHQRVPFDRVDGL